MMRLLTPILAFMLSAIPLIAATQLKIVGSQSMSESEVLDVIGDRLEHIRSQPASPSRASDAAFLVEQLFQGDGFNDALVYWKILNPNLIRLRIDEGPRDLLGEITIIGVENEKVRDELIALFKLNPRKRAGGGTKKLPLRDEDVDAGLALQSAYLNSIGFWEPVLSVTKREPNPETGRIDFTITVEAGKIFRIAAPSFSGERTDGLEAITAPYIGQPADTARVNGLRARVTEYYRSLGFLDAKIKMTLDIGNRKVHPAFSITKGKRLKLGKIEFKGLQKTDPERIAVRMKGLEGNYIDGELVEKRIRQIIATGAFSTLRTDRVPRGGDLIDATLTFEEAEARGVSFKAGFDTYEGPIFGASYYDRNFLGKIRSLSAGFEVTGRTILGELSLADPWLFGTNARGRARLYSLTKTHEGYKNSRTGLEASVSYPFNDHYHVDFILGWALVNTTPDGLLPTDLGETDYNNPYFIFNQGLDYRDSKIIPTKGWHVEVPLELGSAVGDDTTSYFKAGFASSYYRPLGKNGQLAFGIRGGILIPSGGSNQLPIDLRYFTGGARSVRSYRERELGPWSITGYPTGGEAYWVTNAEYIHTVAGPLKGVVFLDAGELTTNWEDFGFDNPAVALGLGIRLDLPIGPVRLEYGHNLKKEARGPTGTWHFAIGTAF